MAPPKKPEPRGDLPDQDATAKMSFFDHLEELRRRILYSLAAIGAGLCIGFYFADQAYAFLARPMLHALQQAKLGEKLVYTSPMGPINLLIEVGLYLGLLIASPFVFHQVWLFVAPGLYRNERKAVVTFLASSVFLFLAGTAFGYYVILPTALQFLIGFGGHYMTPLISINEYFDMVLVILLGLGLIFQLPILIFFLALFGLVTPRFLWDNFRYAVLIISIVAAVVTPTPDALTMIIFMAPMILLYLVGIGISALVIRRERHRGAEAAPAGGRGPHVLLLVVGLGAGLAAPAWASHRSPGGYGGFDGQKAYTHVSKLVALGPRSPASEAIRLARSYLREQLESSGCAVEEEAFSASTPAGRVPMKNLISKIPGSSPNVVLLLTHYDTKQLPDFVGANDGGSSTGLMLEMARVLCQRKNALTIWIGFLDGEEAFGEWSDTDGAYGSREMAARLALSGDLKKIKAVLLADMVGYRDLRFRRESNSTRWLTDMVWATAARLGYRQYFVSAEERLLDDHMPFLRRGVPAVDLIQFEDYLPYWHTSADTLDKLSPRSLAIAGHVLLEVLNELEKKFR